MPRRSGLYPAGSPIFGQNSIQKQWEIKSFADWITKTCNGQNECQNPAISEIHTLLGYKTKKSKNPLE